LNPGHIAVLVRTNKQAWLVRDALGRADVPAVIGGAGSVFATGPAREWLQLLEALERPTSRDRASLVALTSFVGWSAERVATASEDDWEELHWSLHRWAALLRDQGIASLYETVSSAHDVPGRVLARPAGERFMTDLRHVAQLLHEAGASEGLGPTAMATWLGRRIHDADRDAENEERTRRLESDAEAVQVITIHRSKGLEFPIVYCPYMWDGQAKTNEVPVFHDPDEGDVRTIDVGGEGNTFNKHQKMELEEGRGEDLRLLYVALTRARHQAVLWWVGASNSQHSPLARLLFDRDGAGVVSAYGAAARTDADVDAAFAALGPRIAVERVARPGSQQWEPDQGAQPQLEAACFERTLDVEWRRASYSAIVRALHEQPLIGSEPEDEIVTDEEVPPPGLVVQAGLPEDALRTVALRLADMPGGTLVGTVVHSVLERTDFDAPDLSAEVRAALDREVTWRNVDLGDTETVVAGLCAAIECPLGSMVGDLRLCDVARHDRVDELGFELPLVGGDTPTATLHVGELATLLLAHLPADDPVARYAERLRDPLLSGDLRGYLTGSLDLVFRLPDGRYTLADYKTNKLAGPDEVLTAWHYRPGAVDAEMAVAHYPLQGLLYAVALHRYLRWRLAGYDARTHLGPILYLFVRGMSAVDPPPGLDPPCGVWSWQPPPALVESLSELFDRGVTP
jgi:exodeoxyribonuclease V beta subunit